MSEAQSKKTRCPKVRRFICKTLFLETSSFRKAILMNKLKLNSGQNLGKVKLINRATTAVLRSKTIKSGEVFKENFIDIFQTNLEQVAFSLESDKNRFFKDHKSTLWKKLCFLANKRLLCLTTKKKASFSCFSNAKNRFSNTLFFSKKQKVRPRPRISQRSARLFLGFAPQQSFAMGQILKYQNMQEVLFAFGKRNKALIYTPFLVYRTLQKKQLAKKQNFGCLHGQISVSPPLSFEFYPTANLLANLDGKALTKRSFVRPSKIFDFKGQRFNRKTKLGFERSSSQVQISDWQEDLYIGDQIFDLYVRRNKTKLCRRITTYLQKFLGKSIETHLTSANLLANQRFALSGRFVCRRSPLKNQRFGQGKQRLASVSNVPKHTYEQTIEKKQRFLSKRSTSFSLNIKVGDFLSSGDKIGEKKENETLKKIRKPIILTSSGRVVTISKAQLTLQKTQPILFYNSAFLHVQKGEWVKEGSPILTLTHQTLITGDIVQGIPRIEQLFEAFTSPTSASASLSKNEDKKGGIRFKNVHETLHSQVRDIFRKHWLESVLPIAVRKSLEEIGYILVEMIQKVYLSQGVLIADKHIEIIIRGLASKGQILDSGTTGLFLEEVLPIRQIENANLTTPGKKCLYVPAVMGLTATALNSDSFISAASFQETTRVLSRDAVYGKSDFLRGLKEKVVIGDLISAGTGLDIYFIYTTILTS